VAHNLQPVKETPPPAPVEVGAIWSEPGPTDGKGGAETARIHGSHFFINPGQPAARKAAGPSGIGAMLPSLPWKKP
jgi:hypothetical protein